MNQLISKLIELTECDIIKWRKSYSTMYFLLSDIPCYLRKNLIRYRLDFNNQVYTHYYWNLNKNQIKELWIAVSAQCKRAEDADDIEKIEKIFALECPDTRLKKKKRIISEEDIPPPYTDEAANKSSKGIFEK